MRFLGILSVILFFAWACGPSASPEEGAEKESLGKKIYQTNCAICHGDDGRKGLSGAGILPESKLSQSERIQLITKGKGSMMPYQGLLSEEEIKAVAEYTATLQ